MSTFPETRKTTLRRRNEFQFETYDLISIFLETCAYGYVFNEINIIFWTVTSGNYKNFVYTFRIFLIYNIRKFVIEVDYRYIK